MDPLIPKPWVVLIALVLVALLPLNLWLDYRSADYSGGTFTYTIAGLIAIILGAPVGIAALRKSRDDRPDKNGDRP